MTKWNTNNPPKETKHYLVTILTESEELYVTDGLWLRSKFDGKWFWCLKSIVDNNKEVIAWKELPEPYKENLK